MRLYSLTGATAVDDAEFGFFEPGSDGGFDLPGELADKLHNFAIRGKRVWEDDLERQDRIGAEELARRRDPASLYGAVEALLKLAGSATAAQAEPADTGTRKTRGRKVDPPADDPPAGGDGEPAKTA